MRPIFRKLATLFMIAFVATGMFAGGAMAGTVTTTGDLAGDGTDSVPGFAAEDGENRTVTYETTLSTDTKDDFEELSLEVSHDNTTYATYSMADAEVISGGSDGTTVLEVEYTIEHSDLEQLPGDAGEITTADVTITETEAGTDTDETTEFSVDYEFDDTHAVRTVHDSNSTNSIASLSDADDGGMFSFGFMSSSLDTTSEIEDTVGVNGTQTDVHVYSEDSDLTSNLDDSVEDADAGDRVGLLMTSTLDDQIIRVYNEEPGAKFPGSDENVTETEDTYAVYHGNGHMTINLGEDRYDSSTSEVSMNIVSGEDVENDALTSDLDYTWRQANGLTFGNIFSLDSWLDMIPLSAGTSPLATAT